MPERTEWHNLVMWDRAAEIAERYIDKGTKLFVEGKLRTRVWQDANAIKHNITEIIVDNFDHSYPVNLRRQLKGFKTHRGHTFFRMPSDLFYPPYY